MKTVVGIGNPGKRYEATRHNLGFEVVDRLAAEHGIAACRRRFDALVGEGQLEGSRVLLVKPQTYVNLSGSAVAPLLRWYRCSTEDLLVVCDDLNLEPGKFRLRRQGSSGGHNGVQSIIECLGTEEFSRLRIGIGRGGAGDSVAHVLGAFAAGERDAMADAVAEAAEAVRLWVRLGVDAAMNEVNR
ncbi:MAG TPA: aminoacyl-tRNA hydrolase [Planctomycetota bacterium]|nr:aminoacyl-tRNA hydrolase [Planctomycetota bacterium]